MNKRQVVFFTSLCLLSSCSLPESEKANKVETTPEQVEIEPVQESPGSFSRNGKRLDVATMDEVYQSVSLDSLDIPIITSELVKALEYQKKLLKLRKQKKKQQVKE